ncbi:NADH:ubiquinone reductase (Na(+)-transporting) subunit A, partial [bacterium B17]
DQLIGLDRQEIINQLLGTGYLAFIRQRPFSIIPEVDKLPKSIFVNAMNTAPFLADANVVVDADKEAFQAGLDVMTRLTDGKVHLCVGADAGEALKSAKNVELHSFSGPHPAGNTSVHIEKIDAISPHDIVWTIMAVDLVLVGRLFLDGTLPTEKIIALGGSGIKLEGRKHYRVKVGGSYSELVKQNANEGEQRAVSGGVLSGTKVALDACTHFYQSSLTVVPEGRERYFLGWMEPGFNQYSFMRTCVSTFLNKQRKWNLTTNRKGGLRAMVLTGHYDKVMPMNIMVDYLVRAVLAGDTDEAISLGILETDPEDFALCDFICPCKLEVQEIIRKGLKMIEDEGI